MKPHQRKQEQNKPKNADDPNLPVFFYMPSERPYGLFCQWYSSRFTVPISSLSWLQYAHPKNKSKTPPPEELNGTLEFNCTEQFMMYGKALFFSDAKTGELIMASDDPKEQKKLGRQVEGWSDYEWRKVCERVVFEGNWWKFTSNPARKDVLMGTGERELCEASRSDRMWGIGYNAKDAMQYRRLWGTNLLGKALMRVRQKIAERLAEHAEYVRTDWELPSVEMWEPVLEEEQRDQEDGAMSKGKET